MTLNCSYSTTYFIQKGSRNIFLSQWFELILILLTGSTYSGLAVVVLAALDSKAACTTTTGTRPKVIQPVNEIKFWWKYCHQAIYFYSQFWVPLYSNQILIFLFGFLMVVVYLLYLFFHETYPNLLSHETRFGLSKARVISHCLGQCLPTSSILFLARTRSCSSIAEKNKCTRVIRYCIGLVQYRIILIIWFFPYFSMAKAS